MNDSVSIIIPVYNASLYIDDCILSAVRQSYNEIEIILVDDGSTDDSLEKCRQWEQKDERVKVISKENEGVSSARNLAMSVAKGYYFVFLDSDDYIGPNYIELLVNSANEHQTDIVFSAIRIFDKNHSVVSTAYTSDVIPIDVAVSGCFASCNSWINSVWGKLFSRDAITVNGKLVKFDTSLLIGEDYYWLMQVLMSGNASKVGCVAEPQYNYRRFSSYSLTNFRSDKYLERKKSLILADSMVGGVCGSEWFLKYSCKKLVSDYSNALVVLRAFYTKSELKQFKSACQDLVYKSFCLKKVGNKSKLKLCIANLVTVLPFIGSVMQKVIIWTEKKRQERLFL